MIPVPQLDPTNEPEHFDSNCRAPGVAWLQAYPTSDPHDQALWWQAFKPALATHFQERCGWLAAHIGLEGEVDHWLSCGHRKGLPSPNRDLAYEWSNYRYSAPTTNSRKGTHDDCLLDPCEIQDGWFEVHLPSFNLLPTDAIPAVLRAKADFTLNQLQLRNGYHARWQRWNYYKIFWNNGAPDIDQLRYFVPLVAAAVEKAQALGQRLPDPVDYPVGVVVIPRQRPFARRQRTER